MSRIRVGGGADPALSLAPCAAGGSPWRRLGTSGGGGGPLPGRAALSPWRRRPASAVGKGARAPRSTAAGDWPASPALLEEGGARLAAGCGPVPDRLSVAVSQTRSGGERAPRREWVGGGGGGGRGRPPRSSRGAGGRGAAVGPLAGAGLCRGGGGGLRGPAWGGDEMRRRSSQPVTVSSRRVTG